MFWLWFARVVVPVAGVRGVHIGAFRIECAFEYSRTNVVAAAVRSCAGTWLVLVNDAPLSALARCVSGK